ncbi:MAG: sulfite exporter TauE/SafE family protein, partial [Gammaproteobacteria bacterium]|nr:sulfite exporter TauE/SafE family protein [Gammaproteobacteria bacterium]
PTAPGGNNFRARRIRRITQLEDLSYITLAAYAAIMLLAGLIHGTLGLGFPLVATPLLALFTDVRTAILITLLPTASVNIVSILKGGRWSQSIGRFWPLAVFAVLGSIAGTRFLVISDPAPFKLLLAALVLLYLSVSRVKALRMAWVGRHLGLSMIVFGLAAGLAAGTTNVMVPILIIYTLELGLERTAMVQVFNLCFLSGKLTQIAVFAHAGMLTGNLLLSTTPLAIVAVAALFGGMMLTHRIPTDIYRAIVRRVLLVLALVLIVQFFIQL